MAKKKKKNVSRAGKIPPQEVASWSEVFDADDREPVEDLDDQNDRPSNHR